MLKRVLLAFFLLLTSFIYCQNKSKVNIFLDENLNAIKEISFYEKRNSFLFSSKNYENDSLIIHRIIDNIKFGKFDSIENFQIRELLKRHSENDSIVDKTLILTFRDTLHGFESYTKRRKSSRLTNGDFVNQLERFDQNQKKCIKRDLQNDHLRLYFFNYNKGYNYKPENFKWKSSPMVMNSVLFTNRSSMMILKPDGEYFSFVEVYEKLVKELLNTEDWTLFLKDYELAKTNLAKEPFGTLASMHMPEHMRASTRSRSTSLHCYYKGDF